jgi:hypothetical protein
MKPNAWWDFCRAAKQALLFSKKRKQKKSIHLPRGVRIARQKTNESFLLLFFKKEVLAFHLPNLCSPQDH